MTGNLLIPVVRYQQGMSRGIYFSETSKKICGTYYYFEPASDYYLKCSTLFIAVNKMTAYFTLVEGTEREKEAKELSLDIINSAYFDYKEPTSGKKVKDIFDQMLVGNEKVLEWNEDMYAKEDKFDQPLCQVAKNKGLEVVILSAMTGTSRVVTEILDTRDRSISFSSIYQKPNILITEADELN